MNNLTEAGRKAVSEMATRHGVSVNAVEHLLMAVMAGQGSQAQFNHHELGGMGQWSMGGMTMVGDMFNNALKAKVDGLCTELAQLLRQASPLQAVSASQYQSQSGAQFPGDGVSLFVSGSRSGNWWPEDLGQAASTGQQNQMRYAWFPQIRRLAIDQGDGNIRVYDTADHQIGGFSQQQSGDQSLSFTSQFGLVKLLQLLEVTAAAQEMPDSSPPVSDVPSPQAQAVESVAQPTEVQDEMPAADEMPVQGEPVKAVAAQAVSETDIFATIERLAALHAKGILSDAEYQSKKTELLARI